LASRHLLWKRVHRSDHPDRLALGWRTSPGWRSEIAVNWFTLLEGVAAGGSVAAGPAAGLDRVRPPRLC
jgi:hypothetical protein